MADLMLAMSVVSLIAYFVLAYHKELAEILMKVGSDG